VALTDNSLKGLLTIMAAFTAKGIVLPSPVIAYKNAPFKPRLFG
jgi:hypothetical protein